MGSYVAYRCNGCGFATERLSIGWGKSGRDEYWGGLALCPACKELTAVNLAQRPAGRGDRRCTRCQGPLKLIEASVDTMPCPHCGKATSRSTLGVWG